MDTSLKKFVNCFYLFIEIEFIHIYYEGIYIEYYSNIKFF